MVTVWFYDSTGRTIRNVDASDRLPDEVARIEIEGPFESNKSSYKVLKTMLKSSPNRIEKINCTRLSADSPEFLSFLVLICNKTISLNLTDCHLSTGTASCLMAALLTHDGIRCLKLEFVDLPEISANPAKILLEGVASSPCLESFDFFVPSGFRDSLEVGRYLVQALQRNQNLKNISLSTQGFSDYATFHNVVKASILGPNVKSVCLIDSERDLRIDMLRDLLCRKDCTLEKLHLAGVAISAGEDWDGSIFQNVSVKSLAVNETEMHNFTELISIFKSLEELNLSDNLIADLWTLHPLLGGDSQLRVLDVSSNRIGEEQMKHFILEKLQKMKLKFLGINGNNWVPGTANTVEIDALWQSTDLEYVDIDIRDLLFHLDLNRGGKRLFQPSHHVPTYLLPKVLERASKISYYGTDDDWGLPANKEARADVVFWMIQRLAPQL